LAGKSWNRNLGHSTYVVWVEHSVSVELSKGKVNINNKDGLAEHFLGFWNNFLCAFDMLENDIFIAAESYGGMYCPYIAKHFIDKSKYSLTGLVIYKGAMINSGIQIQLGSSRFVEVRRGLCPHDDHTC
jgi:carboxypeptidase D